MSFKFQRPAFVCDGPSSDRLPRGCRTLEDTAVEVLALVYSLFVTIGMGIAEYFVSCVRRVPPTLPNRSSSSYEDISSTRHPTSERDSDPPIELGPSHNPKARRIPWFTFLPATICGAAYATHRYYRRHRPLRLRPRLTSMRLPEIYVVVGTVLSLAMDGIVMQRNMIYNDEDLLIVELAAYRMRAILQNPENSGFRKLIKDNLAELKNSDFPWIRLRDVAYTTGNFWQRVVWWHDNLWADEATWVTTGVTMVVHASGMPYRDALLPTTDPDDWVRCVTHLTNRVNEEEIGRYALYPFLLFIPVAMLARWTRRPVLYLPCNGLQRLLLWAWVYCADWRAHRRLSTLQNIQERRKAALTVKHVFEHDFAEEIACCRMWGVIIGPNNSVF